MNQRRLMLIRRADPRPRRRDDHFPLPLLRGRVREGALAAHRKKLPPSIVGASVLG
jgi:hypothetical protein